MADPSTFEHDNDLARSAGRAVLYARVVIADYVLRCEVSLSYVAFLRSSFFAVLSSRRVRPPQGELL